MMKPLVIFLPLVLLYNIAHVMGDIRVPIKGYSVVVHLDNVKELYKNVKVKTPSAISINGAPVDPDLKHPVELPKLYEIQYYDIHIEGRVRYIQSLLWHELRHKEIVRTNASLVYEGTVSYDFPSESHILDCAFDHILLLLDLEHKGYQLYLSDDRFAVWVDYSEDKACYLPAILSNISKSIYGYYNLSPNNDRKIQLQDEEAGTMRSITYLKKFIAYYCGDNYMSDGSISYTKCQDPQLYLLMNWLEETPHSPYPSILEIASFFSLLPSLSNGKKEMWKRYLVYRGLDEAKTVTHPIAFHNKAAHPLLPFFTAHLALSNEERQSLFANQSYEEGGRKNAELGKSAGQRIRLQEKHRTDFDSYHLAPLKSNEKKRRDRHTDLKIKKLKKDYNIFSHPIAGPKRPSSLTDKENYPPVELNPLVKVNPLVKESSLAEETPTIEGILTVEKSPLSKTLNVGSPIEQGKKNYKLVNNSQYFTKLPKAYIKELYEPEQSNKNSMVQASQSESLDTQKIALDTLNRNVKIFTLPRHQTHLHLLDPKNGHTDIETIRMLLANVRYMANEFNAFPFRGAFEFVWSLIEEQNKLYSQFKVSLGIKYVDLNGGKNLDHKELMKKRYDNSAEPLLSQESLTSYRLINSLSYTPNQFMKEVHPLVLAHEFSDQLKEIQSMLCKKDNSEKCSFLLAALEDAYIEFISFYFRESLSSFDVAYGELQVRPLKKRKDWYNIPKKINEEIGIIEKIRQNAKPVKEEFEKEEVRVGEKTHKDDNTIKEAAYSELEGKYKDWKENDRAQQMRIQHTTLKENLNSFISNSKVLEKTLEPLLMKAEDYQDRIEGQSNIRDKPEIFSSANRSFQNIPLEEKMITDVNIKIAANLRKYYNLQDLLVLWTQLLNGKVFSKIYEYSPDLIEDNDLSISRNKLAKINEHSYRFINYSINQLTTIVHFLHSNPIICKRREFPIEEHTNIPESFSGPADLKKEHILGMLTSLKDDLSFPIAQTTPYTNQLLYEALKHLGNTWTYEFINEDIKDLCKLSYDYRHDIKWGEDSINSHLHERLGKDKGRLELLTIFRLLFRAIAWASFPDNTSYTVNNTAILIPS